MPLPSLFLAAALLSAQDGFPPTPEHRWAHEGVALAIREGVLPEYQYGLYRTKTQDFRSRYEIAVYASVSLSTQLDRTERAISKGTDVERASLLRAGALVPFYRRAVKDFADEYSHLDFHPEGQVDRLEGLLAKLDQSSPARAHSFRDVPAGHWAAKAVGDLRALGLLDGYPDGKFRG